MTSFSQPVRLGYCLVLCALLAWVAACSRSGIRTPLTPSAARLSPAKSGPASPLPLPVNRPVQITFQPDTVLYGAVSADGKRMVSVFTDSGFSSLCLGSPDPDHPILPRQLYRTPGNLSSPALSRDGKWLAFVGTDYDAKGDIYLLKVDDQKSTPRRLTGRDTADGAPCFSPEGMTLYFQQMRPGETRWRLVTLGLEKGSSQPLPLEVGGDGAFPAISPDGKRCAFVSVRDDPGGDIFLTGLEDGKTVALTRGAERDLFPVWSRDGQYVYFCRFPLDTNRDGSITPADNGVIYRARVKTGPQTPPAYPVTSASYSAYNPMTTGSRLYFLSTRRGSGNVWALPLEGEIPRRDDAQAQMELARGLSSLVPRDDHLTVLGYYKVLEAYSNHKPFGGRGCYAIARLYERMGWPNLAEKTYRLTSESFGNTQPEAALSRIRLTGIKAREDWRRAHGLKERHRILEEAQRQLGAVSARHPDDSRIQAQSRIQEARLPVGLGRDSDSLLEAIRLLDGVIDTASTPPDQVAEAMVLRTDLLGRVGRPESLMPGYAKVIEKFPDVEEWANLAVERILDLSLKDPQSSSPEDQTRLLARIAEEYRTTLPKLAMGAWNRMGDIYFAADEWTRAKNAYRQVLDRFPVVPTQTAAARLALAEILYREERFRQALDLYEKEMTTRPYEDTLYRLAREAYVRKSLAAAEFLYRLGEAPSAQKIFLELIREDRNNIQAHRGYIKCAAARRQLPAVLADYRKALDQNPGDPTSLYCVGLCLTYNGEKKTLEQARSLIQRAIQKEGQVEYFHQTMGYLLEVLETVHGEPGRLEEALRSYQKAYFLNNPENDPDNAAHLLLNLGNVNFLLGQYGKAFENYSKRFDSAVPFDNKGTEIQFYRRFGAAAFQIRERRQPVEAYSRALDLIEKRIQPREASEILGKINTSLFDRIIHPILSPRTGAAIKGQDTKQVHPARPAAERLAETQAALNRRLFDVSAGPVAPPPDPSWKAYKKAMEGVILEQKKIIDSLDPLLRRGRDDDLQTVSYMLVRSREALDFPERLIQLKAEMLDRLGLAYQEAGEWAQARKAFEDAYTLNDSLGLFPNLAGNQRSMAFNTYMEAGSLSGEEKERMLEVALEGFRGVIPLIRKYGGASWATRSKKAKDRQKKAAVHLALDLSLDERTASQATYGFSPEQEERLVQAFISRIQTELGRLSPAKEALEQQLISYPSGGPLPDKDLYGVSLLYHRAGQLSYARQAPLEAFNRFRESALLSLRLRNPVSAAINVANMAKALTEVSPENPKTASCHTVLSGLDRRTTRLLEQSSGVLDPLVIPSYHNAMGFFFLAAPPKPATGALEESARQMERAETAGMHFALGLRGLQETVKTKERKALGLGAALHLNMAGVALQCGEPTTARKHFERALVMAHQGLLPEYQWRALAGLGRLDEALEVLESVTLLRAGCGPGEITGVFSPLVADLLQKGEHEEAFNLLERLSEIERVHRMTPLFLGPITPRERMVIGRVYRRLLTIGDLKSRLSRAKGREKNYLFTRLAQERQLLSRDVGERRERLPSFARLARSETTQDRLLVLLGFALEAEELADAAVRAEPGIDAMALRRQYDDRVEQYLDALEAAGEEIGREDPPGIIGVLRPDPVEAIDVMESLPDGATCLRLFTRPGPKGGWTAFELTPDEIGIEAVDLTRPLKPPGDGPLVVIYEEPSLLAAATNRALALNASHLVRSIRYRKPFRRTLLSIGDTDPLPDPFETRSLTADTTDQKILETLEGVNGLLLDRPVHLAGSVPTRPGETPSRFLAIELDQGRTFPLGRLEGRLSNVSLAVLPRTSIEEAYDLGHLFSLFGVPTVLLPRHPRNAPAFLAPFFKAYASASAKDAFQTASRAIRSTRSPEGAGRGLGEGWMLMGYWGMTPEEASAFAQKQFARYVQGGVEAFKGNNPGRALTLFENALQVATENKPLGRYLPGLYKYARESAYGSGETQKAIRYARELAAMIAKKEPDSEAHAEALLKLGIVLARAEQYEKAVPPLEEAVEILTNLELKPEQISALADLGVVLENATEYDRALVKLASAASLSKSLNQKQLLARQSERIGRIYDLRLSQYARAKKAYQEACSIYQQLDEKRQMARSLLDVGRCDRLMGDFGQAQRNYDRAMELAKTDGGDLRLEAKVIMERANNAWYQARYQEAFELQKKVFDLASENDWPLEKVMALNTSGLTWWTLGDHKRALGQLEDALSVARTLRVREDEVATTLNNMGLVYRDMGQFPEALDALDNALTIDRKIKSRWAIAYDLRNKALTYSQMGRSQEAVPLFEEALATATGIGNRINEAKILLGYGDTLAVLGQDRKAEEAYKKALDLSRAMALRETQWRALYGLGRLSLKQGSKREARDLLYQSIQVIETMRAEIRLDQLKDGFIANKMAVYETLVSLLLDLGETTEAFDVSERSRARNLIDLLGNQRLTLRGAIEQGLYDRQKALRARISEQESLLTQATQEAERSVYGRALDRLHGEYKDLMLEIQAKNPELATLVSVNPLRLAEIQAMLDPGVVLMSFYLLPHEILCWLITADSVELLRTPFDREKLGKLILDYRRLIQNLEPLETQSKELYALLLAKTVPKLGQARVIGIIPHDALHYLSFATLSDGENYLGDRYPLFYLPSASVFGYTHKRRKAPQNDRVLAIGNPDLRNPALDLPFAEREVATIGWNFPNITLLTGDKATESWVIRHIDEFGIIHLASHGEFDPINPLFSSVKLARDADTDGNLEVSEVFGLQINADLVVLSACQTGLGRVTSGDDVIGMNRAFLYAGTHAMMSSLWRVSDVSTAMLVKQFYRSYRAADKAESLRKAILHVKNRYPHPGYWGAFILVGDYE